MKLCTFVLAALLAAPAASFAQGRGMGMGVKGGINFSTQETTGPAGGETLDYRIGPVAGAFWAIRLASWLELQSELLYSEKGARLTLLGTKSTAVVDYLEIPFLARVPFGSGHRRYYAAVGPSLGILLRAKTRTTFGEVTEELDVKDQVESMDYGVAAGGGVEIGKLVIDARYTYGFRDIDKDATSETRNRAIALTAGFRF
jgi:Outer membrane protein beta-barrel domain